MQHLRVGSQMDKAVDMGALVDESQMRTISEFVQSARDEGGEVSSINFHSSALQLRLVFKVYQASAE